MVLSRKFGEVVKPEVTAMINSQSDLRILRDWLGEAAAAPSWDVFLKHLRG